MVLKLTILGERRDHIPKHSGGGCNITLAFELGSSLQVRIINIANRLKILFSEPAIGSFVYGRGRRLNRLNHYVNMVDKKSPCLSEDMISTALRTTFAICLSTVSSSFALN